MEYGGGEPNDTLFVSLYASAVYKGGRIYRAAILVQTTGDHELAYLGLGEDIGIRLISSSSSSTLISAACHFHDTSVSAANDENETLKHVFLALDMLFPEA